MCCTMSVLAYNADDEFRKLMCRCETRLAHRCFADGKPSTAAKDTLIAHVPFSFLCSYFRVLRDLPEIAFYQKLSNGMISTSS